MYASVDWLENVFPKLKDEKRPHVLCEYSHAMGNGPGIYKIIGTLFINTHAFQEVLSGMD